MAASSYSASKYLNGSKVQDESRQKNWEMHQLRMNQNLSQLTDALSKTSSKSAFSKLLDANDQSAGVLNENSSTMEFRNYLDDLKRNYMSKLTYSCPPVDKLTAGLKKSQLANARRSLYFDALPDEVKDSSASAPKSAKSEKKASSLYSKIEPLSYEPDATSSQQDERAEREGAEKPDEPELSRTQITSRLIQVREYLKHAYSMISSMHLSSDSINQTAQINKLHTMIEHLKDQEKGYMDLLNSFSKYQQLTETIAQEKKKSPQAQASGSGRKSARDVLDLSVLNDQEDEILDLYSTKKGSKAAETPANSLADSFNASALYNPNRFAQLEDSLKSTSKRLRKSQEPEENNDSSAHSGVTGSFISDTLTLNGANGDEGSQKKYFPKKLELNAHGRNLNDLMVVGQSCFKVIKAQDEDQDEEEEEDKTENDQDNLDDYEYDDNLKDDEASARQVLDPETFAAKRNEVIAAIKNDLAELDELQDQKNLLKSIRLHREELKALNGRRKALEALQKVAIESEMKLEEAFDVLGKDQTGKKEAAPTSPAKNSDEYKRNKQQLSSELNSFNQYLNMLNEKQSERSRLETEPEPAASVVRTSKPGSHEKAPMLRKTFKHTKDSLLDSSLTTQSKLIASPEPSLQIEKSNNTLKKFEELLGISKVVDHEKSLLKPISPVKSQLVSQEQNQLEKHLAELADREKKLEELYAMQAKLSKLSEIVNKFNDLQTEILPQSNDEDEDVEEEEEEEEDQPEIEPMPLVEDAWGGKDLLALTMPLDKSMTCGLKTPVQSLKELMTAYSGSDTEEQLAREQLEEHKEKLENAKQKLKQLQDLIKKLQTFSSPEGAEAASLTPRQQHELQQKEAAAAMELLNQIEKQKREEKIEELQRNKEKLLKLLKDKENESNLLSSSYASNREEAGKPASAGLFEETMSAHEKANADLEEKFKSADSNFESIIKNDKFHSQESREDEDDEDDTMPGYAESPSDLLWAKMKQQLNMRENMRNNKKEIEDMLKCDEDEELERRLNLTKTANKAKDAETNDRESPFKDNEIINGYKEFFMRAKAANTLKITLTDTNDDDQSSSSDDETQKEESSDENDEFADKQQQPRVVREVSTSPMNHHHLSNTTWYKTLPCNLKERGRQQQENICSTDELIKDDGDTLRSVRASKSTVAMATSYDLERDHEAQLLASVEKKLKSHDEQFSQLFQSQSQLNETIQKNFAELFKNQHFSSPGAGNSNSAQLQFQTQMQVQQLMFNLNAAYSELSLQRGEIAKLQEQVKKLNESAASQPSERAAAAEDSDQYRRPSSITTMNALPSYFYNRRSDELTAPAARRDAKFSEEDDNAFESHLDDDDSEQPLSIRIKKTASNINNLFSQARTQLASKQQQQQNPSRHDDYPDDFEDLDEDEDKSRPKFFNNNSEQHTLKRKPSASSTLSVSSSATSTTIASHASSLRKSLSRQKYKTSLPSSCGKKEEGAYNTLATFERMREKIYSEVATLISQNESRPFYLLNLFRELQFVRDKEARDETLRSIFKISNRSDASALELPPARKTNALKLPVNTTAFLNADADDDDDVMTYRYRMLKSGAQKDDDDTATTTPFESDSLSNTVIFVKNSPALKPSQPAETGRQVLSNSSSSSIMSIKDEHAKSSYLTSNVDEEVKGFISKIITLIKVSDDEDDNQSSRYKTESESNTNTESDTGSCYKQARCDSDYLNEIIDKVLSVLKQSNKHGDYLRLCQNQLSACLKVALQKYHNKKLIACLEDILIDISKILRAELNFYYHAKQQPKPKAAFYPPSVEAMGFEEPKVKVKSNLTKSSPRKSPKLMLMPRNTGSDSNSDCCFQRTSKLFGRVRNRDSSSSSSSSSSSGSTSGDNARLAPRGAGIKSAFEALAANTFYFDEQGCQAKLKDFMAESQASKRYIDHSDILKRLKYILDEKAVEKKEQFDDLVENFDNIETISVSKSSSSSSSSKASSRGGSQERASEADVARIKTYSNMLREEDEAKPSQVSAEIADHFAEADEPAEPVPNDDDDDGEKETPVGQVEELKVQDEIALSNEEIAGPLEADIDKAIMECISENLAGESDELPADLQARLAEAPVKIETEEEGAELVSKKSSSSDQASYVMISSNQGDDDAASDDSRQDADGSLKAEDDQVGEEEEEEDNDSRETSQQTVILATSPTS